MNFMNMLGGKGVTDPNAMLLMSQMGAFPGFMGTMGQQPMMGTQTALQATSNGGNIKEVPGANLFIYHLPPEWSNIITLLGIID